MESARKGLRTEIVRCVLRQLLWMKSSEQLMRWWNCKCLKCIVLISNSAQTKGKENRTTRL